MFDPPRLPRLLSKFCFATVSYFLSFHPPFLFLTRSLPYVPTFPPFFGEIFLLPILFIIHVEYLLTYLLNIKHTTDYCTTSSIFRKSHLFSPLFFDFIYYPDVEYLLTYLLNIKHTTDYCTISSIFIYLFWKTHLFSPFYLLSRHGIFIY